MWNVHPVHKLVGWCPSSLVKRLPFVSWFQVGLGRVAPVVCFSICSSAQALKLPWSSSLQLLLVAPFSRDASLAPVLHLPPSKEPPLFQDQDPMKVGKWFTRLKARPSRNSRGEVSDTHPGMSLFRAARRTPGIYFSKHKHTEIQEGRLGGSSVGCREQHTLACWLRVSWALWWFTTNVLPQMPWYLSLGGLHEQPWGLHFAPKTFLRSIKVIYCLALLKFSPGHIFFLSYPLVQSPKLLALFISPILDLGLAFVFNIKSTSVFGLWPFTAVSPPFVGKAF